MGARGAVPASCLGAFRTEKAPGGRRGVTVLVLRPEWCMPALFPFDVHIIFLRLKYMGFVIFHLLKN